MDSENRFLRAAGRPSPSGRVPRARVGPGRWAPGLALASLLPLGLGGCGKEKKNPYESSSRPPDVQVIHPEFRRIVRIVGQPSFVEAYERTAIYPKLTAYIDKWIVDIGDRVNKGDVLARLFVPELVEDNATKKATVVLDEQKVELARKIVEVDAADVKAAEAGLDESQSMLAKYQAEVDRWDSEVNRLSREVSRGVVDPQVLLESNRQLKSSSASRDAAASTIKKAEAELLSAKATFEKSKVDVLVAQASLGVASSESKRLDAWVGYLTLTAPFDGIISARNANTFDFVLPGSGDPNADRQSPDLSPSKSAAPIYVVDRTDIVRIFIDIPEQDANYVKIGTKAQVQVKAFREEPIPATVTRTSWALNVKSRTLRAEVDLTNPTSELLPSMYAYASVTIERLGVPSLPMTAITHSGDQTFCWIYKDGKALRNEIRTGVSDGEYVEIVNIQPSDGPEADLAWKPVTGAEDVILGDLTTIAQGEKVAVVSAATSMRISNGSNAPTRTSGEGD